MAESSEELIARTLGSIAIAELKTQLLTRGLSIEGSRNQMELRLRESLLNEASSSEKDISEILATLQLREDSHIAPPQRPRTRESLESFRNRNNSSISEDASQPPNLGRVQHSPLHNQSGLTEDDRRDRRPSRPLEGRNTDHRDPYYDLRDNDSEPELPEQRRGGQTPPPGYEEVRIRDDSRVTRRPNASESQNRQPGFRPPPQRLPNNQTNVHQSPPPREREYRYDLPAADHWNLPSPNDRYAGQPYAAPVDRGYFGQANDLRQRAPQDLRPYREPPRDRRNNAFDLIRKWNLKFSGKIGEDSEEFLRRVQDGRRMTEMGDRELLACLPFFLEDVALLWYRNNQSSWNSYAQFERAWKARFTHPDYQRVLYDDIRKRTQHPNERVLDYLTRLKSMIDRVQPPLPVDQQIDLAVRNLIPRLHLRLSDTEFQSWAELERVAVLREKSYSVVKEYAPPPTPDKTHFPGAAYRDDERPSRRPGRTTTTTVSRLDLEEELDRLISETYSGQEDWIEMSHVATQPSRGRPKERQVRFEKTHRDLASRSPTPSRSPATSERSSSGTRADGRCYRCGEQGHYISSCKQARRVFCHGCGTRGIYRGECKKCPAIKREGFCRKCGLVGANTDSCPECSGNSQ